jgi:hypothetical protein
MGRTIRRTAKGDPILALGLLFVGVLSLCVAALYPLRSLLGRSSPAELVSNAVVVISADTYLIVAGCLVVSAVATTLGLLLLFLRL